MTPALVSSSTAPIHLPSINYIAILPALILLGGAVVVLAASSLVRGGLRRIHQLNLEGGRSHRRRPRPQSPSCSNCC